MKNHHNSPNIRSIQDINNFSQSLQYDIFYDHEKDNTNIGIDEIQNEGDRILNEIQDEKNVKELYPLGSANNLHEQLRMLKVNATETIIAPQKAWVQIHGDKTVILGTLGNFSLIIGKAKSKKSFFVNIIISTVLKRDLLLNQFKGYLPQDKNNVIYFDTEQGKYHVQLALKRICKQIDVAIPQNLIVYHLRSRKPSERLKLIEHAIYNTPNLGFVVIDGIKDLVTSINDESEATMIASKLLKWTEEKNIHIVTVLHQNKSDNNARGHIGTELINKAETVLSVTKFERDKDISIVEPQMCRNIEPEPFAFIIDEDELPKIVEDFEIKNQTKFSKNSILDLEDNEKYKLLSSLFNNGKKYGYTELVDQIKRDYKNQYKDDVGDNKVKKFITYCKGQNWLIQEKPKSPYEIGEFV